MTERQLDEKYMRAALKQAEKAAAIGEVPIGCVIVCDEKIIGIGNSFDRALMQSGSGSLKIIGRGYNRRNTDKSTLSHAEITAIRRAGKKLADWRLEGCTLYCTLEPCPMCAGAIVQARIDRVVIGADSPRNGCGGTLLNILQNPQFNHQVALTRGVLAEESAALLKTFFRQMRANRHLQK